MKKVVINIGLIAFGILLATATDYFPVSTKIEKPYATESQITELLVKKGCMYWIADTIDDGRRYVYEINCETTDTQEALDVLYDRDY